MALRILTAGSSACDRFLKSLSKRRAEIGGEADQTAAQIIEEVRRGGDRALRRLIHRFDGIKLPLSRLRVTADELAAARAGLPPAQRRALELAARRITAFHRRTLEKSFTYRDEMGLRLGQLIRPMRRVGIYVPGGKGAYPSSVLMNAIPARVAGVPEIAMVSPVGGDGDNPAVLAAAAIAGVSEVYRVGGAQAIAALAYGTATIPAVDKIVGPGNAYVQAAKRMVYGVVDIDKMAGPSEVLIIADESANPAWVAADLIAQAEHGSGDESALLLTSSQPLTALVASEIESLLEDLPRAAAVRKVMAARAAAIVVTSLDQAFTLSNQIAPEHLELDIENPARWLNRVESAGAIFLGNRSPAPLGDYLAGPNHVLPTGGSARFASPLGAYDFLKRTSIIEASPRGLAKLGPDTARLARMEGFEGHARAIEIRLKPDSNRLSSKRTRRTDADSN